MRNISDIVKEVPSLPEEADLSGKYVFESYDLKLETPLFGGGSEAGKFDPERPVRVSSVRGNLRFWWRLLFGKRWRGDDLRKAEAAVWGNTETASDVMVSVECPQWNQVRQKEEKDKYGFRDKFGPECYALFSADDEIAREGLPFTLRVRTSREHLEEVRASVAAWVYFGGLGSRTRRGLGSLSCQSSLPSLDDVLHIAEENGCELTVLCKKENSASMLSAWHNALVLYQDYRIKPPHARFEGKPRPGRSKWPEADSLRQMVSKGVLHGRISRGEHDHSVPNVDKELIPSFPRVALGFPIVVQFAKGEVTFSGKSVTLSASLDGKKKERMASPVITKGLSCNGEVWSAVIILPHADALELLPCVGDQTLPGTLKTQDDKYQSVTPMAGCNNAIDGFAAYVKTKQYAPYQYKKVGS
ncbi:MAG: type III-B CRISPR module RAMP protein Cmr1 [Pyramidobacter sp.]|jgi:CRISPR-associated protein Cmr1